MFNKKIDGIIDELVDQYLENDSNNRPWIIGFSGGKDSTVLLTLVWMALHKIILEHPNFQLKRCVYVVNNDTLVENPLVSAYVSDVLGYIKKAAIEQNLPIKVRVTTPKLEDSFWCCVIGKGYPIPNNAFRYCTEKLKIKPTSQFIIDQINEIGEAIVLIGTRLSESQQRARSINKHNIIGHRLSKHPLNPNTYTYAPIKELLLEEIWYIINSFPSPWGFDNKILFEIYRNAGADDYECPAVVTNDMHTACGQSRFGCWICTVVKEDKSMTALIENGHTWMRPLLDFRNKLVKDRNLSENRKSTRRNGQSAIDESGHNMGNYTEEYRIKTLKYLLETQKIIQKERPHINLISSQELIAIQVLWYRDGIFNISVNDIYNGIYENSITINEMTLHDKMLLENSCSSKGDYKLITDLLILQNNRSLMMNKYGLQSDIESRIENFISQANEN